MVSHTRLAGPPAGRVPAPSRPRPIASPRRRGPTARPSRNIVRTYPIARHTGYTPVVFNRLSASLAIVSLLVALTLAVLWWRAEHGHSDTVLHLGAASAHQTTLFTGTAGLFVDVQQTAADGSIVDHLKRLAFRDLMGGAFVVPCLWGAIWLRRRLRPRPPGSELQALRSL